jgi:sugar lactone lactonase YvrE
VLLCILFVYSYLAAHGAISILAGTGIQGYAGDEGPAAGAELNYPVGVAVDADGDLFIADTANNRIRKVDRTGVITTVAGNGAQGYAGDGGPAIGAELNQPTDVAVDSDGHFYIADNRNFCIRRVDTTGVISTLAGNGTEGYAGDGGPATGAELDTAVGLTLDASGNLYIADANNNRVRRVDRNGTIATVAGNGTGGFTGDGVSATGAELNDPVGLAVDASGNLYIADDKNNRIRKLDTKDIISTVAVKGAAGARTFAPSGVAVDTDGNLYIADIKNNRILKVAGAAVDANGFFH